ncbi:MAG TPA: HAD family phosphatase [Terriglobia bacterium]|nr:HAD family phosphatase [Terriglobia bacterium]
MPPPSAFEDLVGISGIPSAPLLESLWRFRLDYDRGTLDGPAYWRQIAMENGKSLSNLQISQLIEADIALWVHPSPVMLAWAHQLRLGGVQTSILSNMPRDFSAYLRTHARWLNDFDVKVFSGELGVVKPDTKIYQACLQGLAVPPESALFIDDMEANVAAARALGIKSIKFESIARLQQEVARFKLAYPLVEKTDLIAPEE